MASVNAGELTFIHTVEVSSKPEDSQTLSGRTLERGSLALQGGEEVRGAPVQLYSVLVERLRYNIEKLHDEHVEDAVKTRIFRDPQYFGVLHELAKKQGYKGGLIDFITLCPDERDRGVLEKVCKPLGEEMGKEIGGVLLEKASVQEVYSKLVSLAGKRVRDLVEYCRGRVLPIVCGRNVGDVISFRNLSKMMTYVLAMKILAYKLLELHHKIGRLNPLSSDELRSPHDIVEKLNKLFEKVPRELSEKLGVKDFTPIFITELYDKIAFKELRVVELVNRLIEVADSIKESLIHLPGVIGYVYEGFIPPHERHQLGQFYTPPAVAKLISKWAIRSGGDIVLDGGCGSGTFLIEAYKRLLLLKFNKEYGRDYPVCREGVNEHQEILDNLHGVDINAFATQLTSLHLMLMEPRCPFSKLNIQTKDFFSYVKSGFDTVIGNPPYTRWVEIPDDTKNSIERRVRDLMRSYNLTPYIGVGREPGIYVYWILHAAKNLLKNGGRLGMIISNTWLQTNYGVNFGKFLLDKFKIKALIDISYRLFEALISTVIVLAEKEPNEKARKDNDVLLVRIPPIDSKLSDKEVERRLDEALKCIENAITPSYEFDRGVLEECKQTHGIWYRFIKQSNIPRDKKWVRLFFEVEDIVRELENHKLMIRAGEWFMPSRGNSIWSIWAINNGRRPDLGAKDFFYFSRDKVEDWNRKVGGFREAVERYLVPAITASRYVKTFTFTEGDWIGIRDRVGRGRGVIRYPNAWILVLHEDKSRLPSQLREYIKWGETECKTKIRGTRGGGRRCSEAEACKAREEVRKLFYGWYDLGGYIPTPIMAIYHPRYHPQFFLVKVPVVTYDAIMTFIPRVKIKVGDIVYDPSKYRDIVGNLRSDVELSEVEVKALLAYLNSTFNWLWLEQNAGYAAKGPLGLEVSVVERMPVLNIKAIDRRYVEELAKLFDELEHNARSLIGTGKQLTDEGEEDEEEEGGEKFEMFKKLRTVFNRIDGKIAEILGVSVDVDELWEHAWEMMERRVKGAGRKVTSGVEGVEVPVETRELRRGRRKGRSQEKMAPLTKWFEQSSESKTLIDRKRSS